MVRLHLAAAPALDAMLGLIQNDLFDLGADLAVPQRDGKAERLRVLSTQVDRLERDIDSLNANLAALNSFIFPFVPIDCTRSMPVNPKFFINRRRAASASSFVAIAPPSAVLTNFVA